MPHCFTKPGQNAHQHDWLKNGHWRLNDVEIQCEKRIKKRHEDLLQNGKTYSTTQWKPLQLIGEIHGKSILSWPRGIPSSLSRNCQDDPNVRIKEHIWVSETSGPGCQKRNVSFKFNSWERSMQWFLGPCSKMILRRLASGPGYEYSSCRFYRVNHKFSGSEKQAHRSSSYNIHDTSNQKFKETMHLVPSAPFVLTSYSFAKNWPSWLLCPNRPNAPRSHFRHLLIFGSFWSEHVSIYCVAD